jgi:hypothetical protein
VKIGLIQAEYAGHGTADQRYSVDCTYTSPYSNRSPHPKRYSGHLSVGFCYGFQASFLEIPTMLGWPDIYKLSLGNLIGLNLTWFDCFGPSPRLRSMPLILDLQLGDSRLDMLSFNKTVARKIHDNIIFDANYWRFFTTTRGTMGRGGGNNRVHWQSAYSGSITSGD